MKSITATVAAIAITTNASVFAFAPNPKMLRFTTQVNGLFDGMKDAFSAPALERSNLDAERETPIDRWMGWNVKKEEEVLSVSAGTFKVLKIPSDLHLRPFHYIMDVVIVKCSSYEGIIVTINNNLFSMNLQLSLTYSLQLSIHSTCKLCRHHG